VRKSIENVKKRLAETEGAEKREYSRLLQYLAGFGLDYFAYKYVDVYEMACGHYEILQSPFPEEIKDRPKCSRCMIGTHPDQLKYKNWGV